MKDQCSGEYVGILRKRCHCAAFYLSLGPSHDGAASNLSKNHSSEPWHLSPGWYPLSKQNKEHDRTSWCSTAKKGVGTNGQTNVCLSARHMYSHNPASLARFNTSYKFSCNYLGRTTNSYQGLPESANPTYNSWHDISRRVTIRTAADAWTSMSERTNNEVTERQSRITAPKLPQVWVDQKQGDWYKTHYDIIISSVWNVKAA